MLLKFCDQKHKISILMFCKCFISCFDFIQFCLFKVDRTIFPLHFKQSQINSTVSVLTQNSTQSWPCFIHCIIEINYSKVYLFVAVVGSILDWISNHSNPLDMKLWLRLSSVLCIDVARPNYNPLFGQYIAFIQHPNRHILYQQWHTVIHWFLSLRNRRFLFHICNWS